MGARMINQDAPHQLCGNAEELCAVLPAHLPLVNSLRSKFAKRWPQRLRQANARF